MVTLVPGGKGVFRVVADGTELWNKQQTGQFPAPSAIVDRLRALAD